ncbi:DUF2459 domain-containing protein [Shimia sp. NS0008-38b]|uniref:DUF2459 domain-containing protein n=1 Tax=Shimia sp. NS0008-38b TaxID=3127653 RepID=UPI00333F64EB
MRQMLFVSHWRRSCLLLTFRPHWKRFRPCWPIRSWGPTIECQASKHVAAGEGLPWVAFEGSDWMALPLSTEAMQALMFFVENSTHSTQQLGPGLYWNGAFYSGVGKYHVFKTCNSWVSQGLRAAGVASAPGPSVLSSGLLWDLRLRYPDRG